MTTPIADQTARELALQPERSFIVQAPAGSGKTELLIQRYLTLLSTVNAPEEILAITFTKKAASEMRSRIMKALQLATGPIPDSVHQQKTWHLAKAALQADAEKGWHLLENANQCRIMTIDALCTYLTSQLPLLAHFGSTPILADNPQPYYQEAALEILKQLEEETSSLRDDLSTLLLHLDNNLNQLLKLLIALLEKRDQWFSYLNLPYHEDPRALLEQGLHTIIREQLTLLHESFPDSLKEPLLTVLRFCASQLQDGSGSQAIAQCENLTQFPEDHLEDLIAWQAISECLLTKSDAKWRSRTDKDIGLKSIDSIPKAEKAENLAVREQWKNIIDHLRENENLRLHLAALKNLPDITYTEQQWKVLSALLNTLKHLIVQLTITFRQHGEIDFIENALAALTALGNENHPTDLALLLDYQLKHILMDEYQDTSFTQYRLTQMLTLEWQPDDGRTLFIVGDPMQSIYRFRQAEVGLFLRMQTQGINHIPLQPLHLSVNFRSTETIVGWNNAMFSRVFPTHPNVGAGAVNYHASSAYSKNTEIQTTHVTLCGLSDAPKKHQAHQVAENAQQLLNHFPEDDIAILVKSRNHLSEILPALKSRQIDYQAVDIDPLIEHPLIQDLFSLTRALLHPADRIAWLSILRAPWCGLSLADLTHLAQTSRQQLILDLIQQPTIINTLSAEGQTRLLAITPILKRARYERERQSLRSSIESTFNQLQGWHCLSEATDIEIVQTFFDCLEDYQADEVTPTLTRLHDKLKRLYANRQNDARVKIMTIHSSKGLEFDSVIIPHLERKNANDDAALLHWMERTSEQQEAILLLAPIHETGGEKDKCYTYIQQQEKIKANYELNRLLYVATTRAKKRLYLHFEVKSKTTNDEPRIQHGSFLSQLWPYLNQENLLQETASNDNHHKTAITTSNAIRRLPLSYFTNTPSPLPTTRLGTQQRQGFHLPDHHASLLGKVTHRALQYLAEHGIQHWPTQHEQQIRWIQRLLMLQAKTIEHPDTIITEAIRLIKQVLADDKGQWILSSHRESASEFAITYLKQDTPQQLIIDRTFVDETNTRWIIDYKTTPLNDKPLAQFIEEEKEKHRDQLEAYHDAMLALDNRPIKLGLYFIALPFWLEC